MGRPATFRQADLSRAIKAAQAHDLAISGCEITRDGTIRILTTTPPPTLTEGQAELAAYRARRDAKRGS